MIWDLGCLTGRVSFAAVTFTILPVIVRCANLSCMHFSSASVHVEHEVKDRELLSVA